jgi:hypothetical protein
MSKKWVPEVGEQVRSFDDVFVVGSRAKDRETGQVWLFSKPDLKGMKYALEDCEPDTADRTLTAGELKTALDIANELVQLNQCDEAIEMLSNLNQKQKEQVWEALSFEVRTSLVQAKQAKKRDGMRVIVAGSRSILDYALVKNAIESSGFKISRVVCGKAKGVDSLGERWAKENGVQVDYYPADWDAHGKKAGFLRNQQMAENAESLILVWDGKSLGSRLMLDLAVKKRLLIHEVRVSQESAA